MQFCSVIYGRLKKTKKNKHKKLLYKMGEADLWGIKGVLKGYLGFFLLLCEGAATWYMPELSFHITNWQTDKQLAFYYNMLWLVVLYKITLLTATAVNGPSPVTKESQLLGTADLPGLRHY